MASLIVLAYLLEDSQPCACLQSLPGMSCLEMTNLLDTIPPALRHVGLQSPQNS